MRHSALLAVVALACPPAFSFTWTDLWVSHEQHAQHLLDSGHPAEAAALFSSPRRRAYAQSQAGQYAQASQALAPYHDANSQYNRGNALARMGNLPAALAAYDEALKQAPKNADVIHNRALVAAALSHQQRNQTPTGGGSKSPSDRSGGTGAPGHSADTTSSRNGSAGRPGTGGSNSSTRDESGSARKSPAQELQGSPQPREASTGRSPDSPGRESVTSSGANSPARATQKRGELNGDPRTGSPKTADRGLENPQGRESAARPSGSAAQQPGSEPNPHPLSSQDMPAAVKAPHTPKSSPASEQSIAMDQWLRSIPDDSAELLRRKFLVEHMMKQQLEAK
jgi:Ca-activated chloride channel family protein